MAFGGGNVLRQTLDPMYVYEKNSFYEKIGHIIKGAIRGPGYTVSADVTDPKLVDYGSQVYNAQCASCHGANLEGQSGWKTRKANGLFPASPLNGTGRANQLNDQELFIYTHGGGQPLRREGTKSGMPAFGDLLNERDIWAVLAYIKSSWPKEVLRRQEKKNYQN